MRIIAGHTTAAGYIAVVHDRQSSQGSRKGTSIRQERWGQLPIVRQDRDQFLVIDVSLLECECDSSVDSPPFRDDCSLPPGSKSV